MSALTSNNSLLNADEARALTDEIKGTTERLYALLLRAQEGRAWSALGYGSWREYAMTEFQMSQSHAYRLLDQARVIEAIEAAPPVIEIEQVEVEAAPDLQERSFSPMGEKLVPPTSNPAPLPSEREARELRPLLNEPNKLREAWAVANRATGGKPTAEAVRQAREQVAPRPASVPHPAPTPPPRPSAPPAEPMFDDPEIVDAEIVDDARREAELEAAMEGTDTRFRRNFSAALTRSDDVWQFDVDRIAELYAADFEQDLRPWLEEMTRWADRVTQACRRRRTGLRVVSGGQP